MVSIQLPDGSRREFPGPVTVEEVAASIGPGLAKAALGGRIGSGAQSKVVDTSHRIDHDERLAIVVVVTTALFALRRWRYYVPVVIGAGSAIAIAIGTAWFIERTANVSILPV